MSANQSIFSLNSVGVSYRLGIPILRKKQYYQALDDISFEIFEGDAVGVIGKNGAGKSSLLSLLAGVILPDAGKLISRANKVSLLSLSLGFDQNLTGRRNAIMSGMLMGHSRKEIERRLPEIEAFADLGEFFDQPVRTYSTGMRPRLGFAVANTIDTDVLLIDEILAVGDANFREKSKAAMLQKLNSGTTCVLVSHQLQDVQSICSKVIWLEHGRVKMQGNTQDVLAAYRKSEAALALQTA